LKNNRTGVSRAVYLLFLAALALLLGGCPARPWQDPLAEDAYDSAASLLTRMTEDQKLCGSTIEADLNIFSSSPLGKDAARGYFQFSKPSSFKFVVTNPLGQPLLAVAGNQRSYQIINTIESQYIAGGIDAFGARNNIPAVLLHGNWWNWLTAQNSYSSNQIRAIRSDREGRGVWITINIDARGQAVEHLLISEQEGHIQMRIVSDEAGKDKATISYKDYLAVKECQFPGRIEISDFGYGTTIILDLERIELKSAPQQYSLPVPANYFRKLLP
jgi:hypothetical protein